jgi:hypothetical protein
MAMEVEDIEAFEETIFWLDREIEWLRSGLPIVDDDGDIAGEEMTELLSQLLRREGGTDWASRESTHDQETSAARD